nr:GFA family protein [Mitsuaria sp. TWR114]
MPLPGLPAPHRQRLRPAGALPPRGGDGGRPLDRIRARRRRGNAARFHFCPDCGSTVFYEPEALPDFIAIPVGAFADPTFPAPTVSVYEDRMHAWVVPPPDAEHWG